MGTTALRVSAWARHSDEGEHVGFPVVFLPRDDNQPSDEQRSEDERTAMVRHWLLGLTFLPVAASTQDLGSLRTGETVRIRAESRGPRHVEGKLTAIMPERLALQIGEPTLVGPDTTSFALSDIQFLEAKRHTVRSFARTIGISVLVGISAGILAEHLTRERDNGGIDKYPLGGAYLGALVGFGGGIAFGACCSWEWVQISLLLR